MSYPELTHFNEQGRAKMVDISHKPETSRIAVAKSSILLNKHIHEQIIEGTHRKGDVFAVAQVAGIMAAKQTSSIIPMCHPLALTGINIQYEWNIDKSKDHYEVIITGEVKTKGLTGVEMEALTAVTVTALTIYDMCKASGKEMIIGPTMLIHKSGGQHGDYNRI